MEAILKRKYTTVKMPFRGELEIGGRRSHNFNRHLPVSETLQKTNCVKWEKLQVHIPQWCTASCLPLSTHMLTLASTHAYAASVICPSFGGRRRRGGDGARRRSFFTVIMRSFLCREMDCGKDWNWRCRVRDVIPQRAAASNNTACHFYGPTADLSQLHVRPAHTMLGILYRGHGEDHGGHPLTGRSDFTRSAHLTHFLCHKSVKLDCKFIINIVWLLTKL